MPLSAVALILGLVLLGAAIVAALLAAPLPAIALPGGSGLLLILGTIFERVRYKALASKPPGPGWIATEERFRDPASERWVQVYFNPATGERRYVETPPPTR